MKVISVLILCCLLTTGLFKNCENENTISIDSNSSTTNKKINNNTVTTLQPIIPTNISTVKCLCNSANRL